jgi:hypothetical protein
MPFCFALLFVLLILVAADCFGKIAFLSPFAHWVREYTTLIWVPFYYIGWATEPFKPIMAPPYAALMVRAWKRGRLLSMLLYANAFLSDPVFDLIFLGSGSKRKLNDWTLAGEWVGMLGLIGAEIMEWDWDRGLFDLLGVPGEKVEKNTVVDAEKSENGIGLRSEQETGETIELEENARLIET